MIGVLLSVLCLAAVYCLMLASFGPWDLCAGVVFGAAGMVLFRRGVFLHRIGGMERMVLKPFAMTRFIVMIGMDIVQGTWQMMLITLGLRPLSGAGIVAIPVREPTDRGLILFALAMTLSPGSVLLEVDWENRVMWFHVMAASDPERVREKFRRYYEYQRPVFP